MHVPKTGSSFANALVHLPGVCPRLPENISIDREHFGTHFLWNFRIKRSLDTACQGLDPDTFTSHTGFAHEFDQGHNIPMMMMRQPEQRLISAYHHAHFGCPAGNHTLEECAKLTSGCAVRMLTRRGAGVCSDGKLPTDQEVKEASKRLLKFGFVGLTDRWDLSICLLHKMFGGNCTASEFKNTRLGKHHKEFYDASTLAGYKDKYDGELYNLAEQIFRVNQEKYAATPEGCAECWAQRSSTNVSRSTN